MHFGSFWFGTSLLFLEAKTGEMSKLMTSFTLIFLGWALKSLYVTCISTFGTCVLVLMCALGIKSLLMLVLHLVNVTVMLLVILLLWLHRWPFLLVFACWKFCALVPEEIDLHGLGVTCNLLYVMHRGFWALHPFGKVVHSACGKCIQIYTSITDDSWHKLLISQEKLENVSMKDLSSFWGYLARLTCAWTTLYHSSMLQLPCPKLVRRSKWAHTLFDWGLQNSSNFPQIVSNVNFSDGKLQDTYWSMPKSPDHAINFLHFWHSGNAASSYSKIFSHFKHHFKNLWQRPSLTAQSSLGPSV